MKEKTLYKILVNGKSFPISNLTVERFWKNVDKTNDCWIWKLQKDACGYGRFYLSGRQRFSAHRFSFIVSKGTIKNSLLVLHKCNTPACVNPNHLYLGNHTDNMRDRKNSGNYPVGKMNNKTKLTITDVLKIRSLYKPRLFSSIKLAKMFQVSKPNILAIVKNKTWTHI